MKLTRHAADSSHRRCSAGQPGANEHCECRPGNAIPIKWPPVGGRQEFEPRKFVKCLSRWIIDRDFVVLAADLGLSRQSLIALLGSGDLAADPIKLGLKPSINDPMLCFDIAAAPADSLIGN